MSIALLMLTLILSELSRRRKVVLMQFQILLQVFNDFCIYVGQPCQKTAGSPDEGVVHKKTHPIGYAKPTQL